MGLLFGVGGSRISVLKVLWVEFSRTDLAEREYNIHKYVLIRLEENM